MPEEVHDGDIVQILIDAPIVPPPARYSVARSKTTKVSKKGDSGGNVAREDDWTKLAKEILDADEVTVVGIAPPALLKSISDEFGRRKGIRRRGTILAVELTYLTPLPGFAPLNALPAAASRYVRLWQYGLKRMTRLMDVLANPGEQTHHTANGVPFPFPDCMIKIVPKKGGVAIHLLTALPTPDDRCKEGYAVWSRLGSTSGEIANWIDQLGKADSPVVLREVQCRRIKKEEVPKESDFPRLTVQGLSGIGQRDPRHDALSPVAIVVPRVTRKDGVSVLLHLRDRLWNEVDEDVLSLPSALVQDTDIARSFKVHVPDSGLSEGAALDDLSERAGVPSSFTVPEEAYLLAAQRAVSLHLGLAVEPGRLEYRGFRMLEIAGSNRMQNGYAVFTLELAGGGEPDTEGGETNEINLALQSAPVHVEEIPVARLFPRRPRADTLKLNRLLRSESAWLMDHCLQEKGV